MGLPGRATRSLNFFWKAWENRVRRVDWGLICMIGGKAGVTFSRASKEGALGISRLGEVDAFPYFPAKFSTWFLKHLFHSYPAWVLGETSNMKISVDTDIKPQDRKKKVVFNKRLRKWAAKQDRQLLKITVTLFLPHTIWKKLRAPTPVNKDLSKKPRQYSCPA